MTNNVITPAARRRLRRDRVLRASEQQAGVLSRAQIYALGISRAEVRANVAAKRWRLIGRHCLATHTGPISVEARHWVAVLEGGPRAFIDGESSLVLAGLKGYEVQRTRVTVPRGARTRHRGSNLNIRQTRRWRPDDLHQGGGVPRSREPVAAVRASLWAVSDRQAVLLLTMTVQQNVATVTAIAREMLNVKRDKRRALLHETLLDLAGGVGSLHELDVLNGCRARGLPEPDSQVLRRTPSGSYYLDFRWKRWRVVLEVDGIQHNWAKNLVADALRHNSIAMTGDTVLRLPVLGLRLCEDEFFAQIAEALRAAGCTLPEVAQDVIRVGRYGHRAG